MARHALAIKGAAHAGPHQILPRRPRFFERLGDGGNLLARGLVIFNPLQQIEGLARFADADQEARRLRRERDEHQKQQRRRGSRSKTSSASWPSPVLRSR